MNKASGGETIPAKLLTCGGFMLMYGKTKTEKKKRTDEY